MNKTILDKLLRKPPGETTNKYIFLVDNRSIAEAIVTVGFQAVYIANQDSEYFFSADSFAQYIRDKANTGTAMLDFVFVLACFRKRTNDTIEYTLKSNQLEYKIGAYTLFKDKEYLGNYERQDELEDALKKYMRRFEGPEEPGLVDKEQFIKRDPDGKERGIMEKALVDYIVETVNFFVVGATAYVYHGGVYREDTQGIEMKSIIQSLLYDRHISYRTISGVYRLLIEQPQVQKRYEDLNAYPDYWINFRNGMFDVKAQRMLKHSPQYFAINQVPHDFRIDLQDKLREMGVESRKFLSYAIPDQTDQMMLFEYLGYCMTKDTCLQKFMILRGTGGTGKSSVISVIQNIIGLENTSGISMEDLTQRFYPSQLRGKLLNACADISAQALTSIDTIKKATGEDLLIYERKGADATTFRSYAKLLFSANQIPLNLDEKSDALYRRMLILVMDRKPKKVDLELDAKLAAELDWWIWQAIYALKTLYAEGKFRESAGCKEEVEKLHRAADTVKAFMNECTRRQQGTEMKREVLYEQYTEYCKSYGRKAHSPNAFYRNLEDKGYTLKRKSSGRYVMDIVLVDDGFLEIDEHDKVPFEKK